MSSVYRFRFDDRVPGRSIEDSLFWATFHAESVFGKPRVRLEASLLVDKAKRICIIDRSTEIGQHIAQVFTSLITREFGEESFSVERVSKEELKPDGTR